MPSPFAQTQERASQDHSSEGAVGRVGGTVLSAVLPELRLSRELGRRRLLLLLGGMAVFTAVVAFALFTLLGKEEKTARHAATLFAAALVHDDPHSAPPGASGYVNGLRAHFGPVRSAELIALHNKGVNTGDQADTRNYYVADLLLRTGRGPAVVELAFDNHSLSSEEVTGVRELRPEESPALGLPVRGQLATAFAARGGKPAKDAVLRGPAPVVAGNDVSPAPSTQAPVEGRATPTPVSDPQLEVAAKRLRCVQEAHGDVRKLASCG